MQQRNLRMGFDGKRPVWRGVINAPARDTLSLENHLPSSPGAANMLDDCVAYDVVKAVVGEGETSGVTSYDRTVKRALSVEEFLVHQADGAAVLREPALDDVIGRAFDVPTYANQQNRRFAGDALKKVFELRSP